MAIHQGTMAMHQPSGHQARHRGSMTIHHGTMAMHQYHGDTSGCHGDTSGCHGDTSGYHGVASGHHDIYLSLLFSGEVAVGMIFDMALLSIGMVGYDQVSRLQHNYVRTYVHVTSCGTCRDMHSVEYA